MVDPLTWPSWVQALLVTVLVFGAALAWFTAGAGLLVIAAGLVFGLYFHVKHSKQT